MKNIKYSIIRTIMLVLMLSLTIVGGTYAWYSYQTKKSSLTLSIGDIENTKITAESYQIKETLTPVNDYKSGVYTQITAVNDSNHTISLDLYYKINSLNEILINNGLKYTITSSTTKNGEYKELKTSNFTVPDIENKLEIYNVELEKNTTTYYKVYIWLDNSIANQSAVQNLILDLELNGTSQILN